MNIALIWNMIRQPKDTYTYLSQQGGHQWRFMAALATVMVVVYVIVSIPISAGVLEGTLAAYLAVYFDQIEIINPEILNRIVQIVAHPILTIGFVSMFAVIQLWIGWLLWTLALHLASTWLGGKHRFGQIWLAVVWSWLPFIVWWFLSSVFTLFTGEYIANPTLSRLFDTQPEFTDLMFVQSSAWQLAFDALLARIGLFQVWNLVLIAIGIMVAANLSKRRAALVTLVVWGSFTFFYVLTSVATTLIFTRV